MSRTNRNGIAKGIRWAARVIGLVITAFSFIMVAGDAIAIMLIQDEGFKLDTGDFLFVIMPVIIAVRWFYYILVARKNWGLTANSSLCPNKS